MNTENREVSASRQLDRWRNRAMTVAAVGLMTTRHAKIKLHEFWDEARTRELPTRREYATSPRIRRVCAAIGVGGIVLGGVLLGQLASEGPESMTKNHLASDCPDTGEPSVCEALPMVPASEVDEDDFTRGENSVHAALGVVNVVMGAMNLYLANRKITVYA
jgi:hypothetical protein